MGLFLRFCRICPYPPQEPEAPDASAQSAQETPVQPEAWKACHKDLKIESDVTFDVFFDMFHRIEECSSIFVMALECEFNRNESKGSLKHGPCGKVEDMCIAHHTCMAFSSFHPLAMRPNIELS